jgi:PE family
MSFVTAFPDAIAAATGTLQGVGSAVSSQNAAAAAPITGVVPPAADPVSALTATAFVTHATLFNQMSAEAEAIHEQFIATLGLSGVSYFATEAANAATAG